MGLWQVDRLELKFDRDSIDRGGRAIDKLIPYERRLFAEVELIRKTYLVIGDEVGLIAVVADPRALGVQQVAFIVEDPAAVGVEGVSGSIEPNHHADVVDVA